MKKRILALVLSVALCTMMCETAFAASSSTSGSSSTTSSSSTESSESVSAPAPAAASARVETPATRGTENTDNVAVAVKNADGTVSTVNLTQYTTQTNNTVVAAAAAAAASATTGGQNPGEAVSAVLTTPASDIFKATINALGGNIRMVNAGGYKVTAVAPGADGRKVASVGTVKGVTKYAFIILISVNEDGTIETVEGTVDPVTLQVMGAFKGTPKTITVSVIMAKK